MKKIAEFFETIGKRAVRINAIMRKEIKSLVNDKVALLILVAIPISLIVVLGSAGLSMDMVDTTVWIIDQDNTEGSEAFISTFKRSDMMVVYSSGDLAPIEPELGEEEAYGEVSLALAEKTLPTEYISAYIILPPGFEESMKANGTSKIIVYYDAIDMTSMFVTDLMILLGTTNVQLENLMFERDLITYPETRPAEMLDTSNLNILEISSPFFIPIMLFFSLNLIVTQCIVGDIPLKRMLNTSLRRGEVVTGKIAAFSVIAILQIIVTLLLLEAYDVDIKGLWIDVFIILLLNSVASISMGVFISTISKTRLQGSQLFLMVFFVLMIFQYYVRDPFVIKFIPLEQCSVAFTKIAFRGLGFMDILPEIFYLLVSITIFYLGTVIAIRRKKEFV